MSTDPKVTQTLKLPEKDFRVAIIKLLQQVIINITEMNRKIKVIAKEGWEE